MRNKKTGQEAYRVDKVDKVDYEFECETLADFKYAMSDSMTNKNL
eukprot:CAMPEP_0116883532 /NCGR_PEP_ID=MMETSP0463-20121206/16055_1 /TAXON_ID=181622 /ORGANISM="Strombidinopsis sp, Strain SopsisLIS2011" /LENGTH=44 /DNA_ID= /DNA_START= /DNA_END= /DNA_ORIENTATION=